MLWRCATCGGTYNDRSSDGVLYFHACPPLRVVVAPGDPDTHAGQVVEDVARPDARDERPGPQQLLDPSGNIVAERPPMRAEGRGRTRVG